MTALIKVIHRPAHFVCQPYFTPLSRVCCVQSVGGTCSEHLSMDFPSQTSLLANSRSYSRLHTSYPGSFWTYCSFLIPSLWKGLVQLNSVSHSQPTVRTEQDITTFSSSFYSEILLFQRKTSSFLSEVKGHQEEPWKFFVILMVCRWLRALFLHGIFPGKFVQ